MGYSAARAQQGTTRAKPVAIRGGLRVRWAKLMFDMKVQVLRHQSRSGQVRTESCERAGNVVFEA